MVSSAAPVECRNSIWSGESKASAAAVVELLDDPSPPVDASSPVASVLVVESPVEPSRLSPPVVSDVEPADVSVGPLEGAPVEPEVVSVSGAMPVSALSGGELDVELSGSSTPTDSSGPEHPTQRRTNCTMHRRARTRGLRCGDACGTGTGFTDFRA